VTVPVTEECCPTFLQICITPAEWLLLVLVVYHPQIYTARHSGCPPDAVTCTPGGPSVAWRSRKKDGVHARPEAFSTPERPAL
jgi:hypothetical protein